MADLAIRLTKLVTVLLLVFALSPSPVHATGPERVLWDTLVLSVKPYDDPFIDMSYENMDNLRDVLRDGNIGSIVSMAFAERQDHS